MGEYKAVQADSEAPHTAQQAEEARHGLERDRLANLNTMLAALSKQVSRRVVRTAQGLAALVRSRDE